MILDDSNKVMTRVLTALEHSHIQGGKGLEGSVGEVKRVGATARAFICSGDLDGLSAPGKVDLLVAVLGPGIGVSPDSGVEGNDEVVVRVHGATSTGDTVLIEPGGSENWVRK